MLKKVSQQSDKEYVYTDKTYFDLKRMAARQLNGNTLQRKTSSTSLVHDALIKFGKLSAEKSLRDRKQFFAAISLVMRSVIIDRARRESTGKRIRDELSRISGLLSDSSWSVETFERLERALSQLNESDSLTSQVVHMRFFLDLPYREIAEQLDISERKAQRLLAYGKGWLRLEMETQK